MTLDDACMAVNDAVGMPRAGWSDGMRDEIVALAADVGLSTRAIIRNPEGVARKITAWLDLLARDP